MDIEITATASTVFDQAITCPTWTRYMARVTSITYADNRSEEIWACFHCRHQYNFTGPGEMAFTIGKEVGQDHGQGSGQEKLHPETASNKTNPTEETHQNQPQPLTHQPLTNVNP